MMYDRVTNACSDADKDVPVPYNAWLVFRLTVDVVLANDLAACPLTRFCVILSLLIDAVLCCKFWELPDMSALLMLSCMPSDTPVIIVGIYFIRYRWCGSMRIHPVGKDRCLPCGEGLCVVYGLLDLISA